MHIKSINQTYKVITALALSAILLLSTGCGGGSQPASTPDKVAQQIADGMAQNKPQVAWQSLPASYQKEATELIHDYGKKMDTPEFAKTTSIAKKAGEALKEKKQFFLKSATVNMTLGFMGMKKETVEKNWDPVVSAVNTLASSALLDAKKMQSVDIESFLSSTGSQLMQDMEKDTVDFVPNYDETRTEPTVFPAAFPNLLVNGGTGIELLDFPNLLRGIDSINGPAGVNRCAAARSSLNRCFKKTLGLTGLPLSGPVVARVGPSALDGAGNRAGRAGRRVGRSAGRRGGGAWW